MKTQETLDSTLTCHAQTRMSQRGYLQHDIELIPEHGTPVADGYVLTEADVATAPRDLPSRDRQRLEHLVGTYLVLRENVITIYRPGRARWRRLVNPDLRRRPRRRRSGSVVSAL